VCVVACRSAATPAVTLNDADAAVTSEVGKLALPKDALESHSGEAGAWARAIAPAKGFAEHRLPNHGSVLLTWRVRPRQSTPIECDYDALDKQTFDLIVSTGEASVDISLGTPFGFPDPRQTSYCRTDPVPHDITSTFTVSSGQAGTRFVAVRDHATLHILVQQASFIVKCDSIAYGPLEGCEGREWARLADLEIGAARVFELVDDRGRTIDCGMQGCAFA
jgi:hypothetical protein